MSISARNAAKNSKNLTASAIPAISRPVQNVEAKTLQSRSFQPSWDMQLPNLLAAAPLPPNLPEAEPSGNRGLLEQWSVASGKWTVSRDTPDHPTGFLPIVLLFVS